MWKSSWYDDFTTGDHLWKTHYDTKTSIWQSPTDDNLFGINKLLCLPKVELKTKNSTKRRRKASFGWVFGFQLDLLEKHLITLTVLTFTPDGETNLSWLQCTMLNLLCCFKHAKIIDECKPTQARAHDFPFRVEGRSCISMSVKRESCVWTDGWNSRPKFT